MLKRYQVTWVTKQGGREFYHEAFCKAESAKDARGMFDLWYASKPKGTPHAFRVKVAIAIENRQCRRQA